jgi:hypothetical protein
MLRGIAHVCSSVVDAPCCADHFDIYIIVSDVLDVKLKFCSNGTCLCLCHCLSFVRLSVLSCSVLRNTRNMQNISYSRSRYNFVVLTVKKKL